VWIKIKLSTPDIVSDATKKGDVDNFLYGKIWKCQNVRGLVRVGIIPYTHIPPLSPTINSHILPPYYPSHIRNDHFFPSVDSVRTIFLLCLKSSKKSNVFPIAGGVSETNLKPIQNTPSTTEGMVLDPTHGRFFDPFVGGQSMSPSYGHIVMVSTY